MQQTLRFKLDNPDINQRRVILERCLEAFGSFRYEKHLEACFFICQEMGIISEKYNFYRENDPREKSPYYSRLFNEDISMLCKQGVIHLNYLEEDHLVYSKQGVEYPRRDEKPKPEWAFLLSRATPPTVINLAKLLALSRIERTSPDSGYARDIFRSLKLSSGKYREVMTLYRKLKNSVDKRS